MMIDQDISLVKSMTRTKRIKTIATSEQLVIMTHSQATWCYDSAKAGTRYKDKENYLSRKTKIIAW